MNANEMIKDREQKFKFTLEAIEKVEKECAFLKKCITYGFDTKTRGCVTQDFVDNRVKLLQTKVEDIPFNYYYDTCIRGVIKDYIKIAQDFAKCLLGV